MWLAQQIKPTGQVESLDSHTTDDICRSWTQKRPQYNLAKNCLLHVVILQKGWDYKRNIKPSKWKWQKKSKSTENQAASDSMARAEAELGCSPKYMNSTNHMTQKLNTGASSWRRWNDETKIEVIDAVSQFYTVCKWTGSTMCRDWLPNRYVTAPHFKKSGLILFW